MTKLMSGGFGLCVLAGALVQPVTTCCAEATRGATFHEGIHAGLKSESPLYCNLGAFTTAQRKHKAVLDKSFRSLARAYREVPDGYEFKFPNDPKCVELVAEWAAMERLCCPFFDMDLRLEREGGQFWFRLTGRQGVKDFIAADFQPIKNHTIPKE